jgi:hypothetical protein
VFGVPGDGVGATRVTRKDGDVPPYAIVGALSVIEI